MTGWLARGVAAFDRSGIHDPDVIGPYAGIGGQDADAVPDQQCGGAQPLVVAGLLGQVREQVPQVSPGVPQPPGLGGESQQGLHDGKSDQLSVAQLHPDAYLRVKTVEYHLRNCYIKLDITSRRALGALIG